MAQTLTIPHKIGARIPKDTAQQIVDRAPRVPDGKLRERVDNALNERPAHGKGSIPIRLRRRKAGRLLLQYLEDRGGFVRSQDETAYYFHEPERRLFQLDTPRWIAWLYSITGINPASTDFAYLKADCDTTAIDAPTRKIAKVASWDNESRRLRVSRYDGTVYVLDGDVITEEANGESVIFDDDPAWEPYTPDFGGAADPLNWSTTDLPYWAIEDPDTSESADKAQRYGLAYRVWWLTTFFSELCPTRPMAVSIGEMGSGKTSTLRANLCFMFGPNAEVSGVPDKPDGFTAAASAAHVLVLDNLDEFTGWLRDKLARLSTGAEDHYRQLYTNNALGRVRYRCWLAFTSRTPDTLRREDLADRLLLLPMKRIDDEHRLGELDIQEKVATWRGSWWGEVLTELNAIVAAIRTGGIPNTSKLRMADWEALGRVIARVEDQESTWDKFVQDLQVAQSGFLLEDDLIVEGLSRWLRLKDNQGRKVTASTLHGELETLLFEGKKPPRDWSTTTRGFSRRLANLRRQLLTLWDVLWDVPSSGEYKNLTVYTFKPKAKAKDELVGE